MCVYLERSIRRSEEIEWAVQLGNVGVIHHKVIHLHLLLCDSLGAKKTAQSQASLNNDIQGGVENTKGVLRFLVGLLIGMDGIGVLPDLVLLSGEQLDGFVVEQRVDCSRLHCIVERIGLTAIPCPPVRHENGRVDVTHHCNKDNDSKVNVESPCQVDTRDCDINKARQYVEEQRGEQCDNRRHTAIYQRKEAKHSTILVD